MGDIVYNPEHHNKFGGQEQKKYPIDDVILVYFHNRKIKAIIITIATITNMAISK